MPSHDAAYFVAVVCVPLVARLLMVPRIGEPVWAWSERVGEQLWTHLADRPEPDEVVLRRWALVRLAELEGHLARVRRLLIDDDDMSATRQRGNRLAYERLVVDVAEAAAAIPEGEAEPAPALVWQPPSGVRYLPSPAPDGRGRVEVLEF